MKIYVVEIDLDFPTPIRSVIVCKIGFEDLKNEFFLPVCYK